jgi:hypothetical protein
LPSLLTNVISIVSPPQVMTVFSHVVASMPESVIAKFCGIVPGEQSPTQSHGQQQHFRVFTPAIRSKPRQCRSRS